MRCRRVDQSASYPVRDLTDRELFCRRVVLYTLMADVGADKTPTCHWS